MKMLIYIILIFLVLPTILLAIVKHKEQTAELKRQWQRVPTDSISWGHRTQHVEMPYADFIKYYHVNPDAYHMYQDGSSIHPVREDDSTSYVINFPTLKEYKQFIAWYNSDRAEMENDAEYAAFLNAVRKDIDRVQREEAAKVKNL